MPSIPRLIVGECQSRWQSDFDLSCFLFKGAAALKRSDAVKKLVIGDLGHPREVRLPLLTACHDVLRDKWEESGSRKTLHDQYRGLSALFQYADEQDADITIENAKDIFLAWRNDLTKDTPSKMLEVKHFGTVAHAGRIIAAALNVLPREFLASANVFKPKGGFKTKHHDLTPVQPFVGDLIDIADSLSEEKILGRLPISINLSSTGRSYEHFSGLQSNGKLKPLHEQKIRSNFDRLIKIKLRDKRLEDVTIARRHSIFNLKCATEFLLFVAGTGMNRSEVQKLRLVDYRFQLNDDAYTVKGFKSRGELEVEFSILRDYKPYFESWLRFRRKMYPDGSLHTSQENLLFPTISLTRTGGTDFNSENVRRFLVDEAGRTWVTVQMLRKCESIYISRTMDGQVAESIALQHSPSTFIRNYHQPDSDRAARELTAYFKTIPDSKTLVRSALKGNCTAAGAPSKHENIGAFAPEPDCTNPAGCLACKHHKGVASFEYVWGLLTFRELKREELASYKNAAPNLVSGLEWMLTRIEQILDTFQLQNKKQREWYESAVARIERGEFHSRWRGFITMTRTLA